VSIDDRVHRRVRAEIRSLHAYGVADARGLIKLDAMENPYTWPEEIRSAWLEHLRTVDVNRYPDPAASALQSRLREVMDVPRGQSVLLGNGSDELIQMILLALALPDAVVLAPTPTFVMYDMTARFAGMKFIGVPLRAGDFSLDLETTLDAIREHDPAVIFLAWPNNPTGNLFDRADVEAILAEASGLVVVDEAYHAFAGASFMDRLGDFENLVVMRTVSKLGLAGLRLGLLAGPAPWLNEFNKVRLPYNINVLTQATAEFVLGRRDWLEQQTAYIRSERTRVAQALASLPAVRQWPSAANFILFRVERRAAADIHSGLRDAGILIKNLDGSHPLLAGCLRVTIGTPQENDAFLAALKKLCG
jgi:histidinol-phosphate aminotransferase